MSLVTKCDACGKDTKHPDRWLCVQEFGVISAQQPPHADPVHLCSYQCMATWAEAHVLADKKKAYSVVGKR